MTTDTPKKLLLDTTTLWSVEDVSKYLKIKPETVRSMARQGKLPCIKMGKRLWRFRPDEIIAWVDRQLSPSNNP